jgi:hypothetical protein
VIPRPQGNIRLLRDLLADSMRENRRLSRLVATLRLENACLRAKYSEFDLDADSEVPRQRRQAN